MSRCDVVCRSQGNIMFKNILRNEPYVCWINTRKQMMRRFGFSGRRLIVDQVVFCVTRGNNSNLYRSLEVLRSHYFCEFINKFCVLQGCLMLEDRWKQSMKWISWLFKAYWEGEKVALEMCSALFAKAWDSGQAVLFRVMICAFWDISSFSFLGLCSIICAWVQSQRVDNLLVN